MRGVSERTLRMIEARAIELGNHVVKTKRTVRQVARDFGISKSTAHTDLSRRLKKLDFELYEQVRDVIEDHKILRSSAGGVVTKKRYDELCKSRLPVDEVISKVRKSRLLDCWLFEVSDELYQKLEEHRTYFSHKVCRIVGGEIRMKMIRSSIGLILKIEKV